MKKTEHFLLPLLIVSLLVAQLMSPITVFADGETPPVTSESTDEVAPPDEPVETDEASVEETAPADEPSAPAETPVEETNPAEGTPEPEGTPADEVVPESAPGVKPAVETESLTVAEALEQAPTGTEIVVVNAEGQIEQLASTEAAEIVAAADPLWCPTGQAPTPGANGCTSS